MECIEDVKKNAMLPSLYYPLRNWINPQQLIH
jgi:hypothetical protein